MAQFKVRPSISLTAAALCVLGLFAWTASGSPSSNHVVVVAELFTSEGCSSCPPADDVLRRLVSEPLGGAIVLGLGEHVDYWDHQGWKDPFSSPAFSTRQADYQRQVFRTGSVYTPQLVVDGQFEAVGSDVAAVRRAVDNAAKIPKAVVDIDASPSGAGQLRVHVNTQVAPAIILRERADMIIALTQDHLTSDVRRGENSGRTLTHSAVVRSLTTLGVLDSQSRGFDKTVTMAIPADWKVHDLRVVGFLQERGSRRIVGAGSTARLGAFGR